jgi:hypothetical protein
MATIEPVVLFFLLGFIAALLKSDLRIPDAFYNTLNIYLLLSIGIKGGIELYHAPASILIPAVGTIVLGLTITLLAFFILHNLGKFDFTNSLSIAAHYGSVSAVTFAVIGTFLKDRHIPYESFMTVLLVLLEIPSIALAIGLARWKTQKAQTVKSGSLLKEVFLGKSILLLLGGLGIGWYTAWCRNEQLNFFFFDLFKGFLALFLLEMGIVAAGRMSDLKKAGMFLVFFGVAMPLFSAALGMITGKIVGLSEGGAIVLATMAASASYIAAPAAMKFALPDANPTFSMTAALGITFPFNILIGIPLYTRLGEWLFHLNL